MRRFLEALRPSAFLIWAGLLPAVAQACACGCGMFDIGLPGLGLPGGGSGGSFNLQATRLVQDEARSGTNRIPMDQSPDQKIQTDFLNANFQYNFNHDWGVMAMVPYWQRSFYTNTSFGSGMPTVANYQTNTLSDIRLMGMYTGISPDMSVGLIFGLKLPTGTYTAPGFDRDTEPGTGTTDLLLGGYRVGQLRTWGWYLQGMVRSALDSRSGYRPGDSLQLVAGAHYDANPISEKLVPLLQLNLTLRRSDSGMASDPANSGSRSLYLTPGALYGITKQWQANAFIYLPLYQQVTGIQLVPRQIASAGITYSF
ncbi:MAG: hypothetical protein KGM40_05635 [Betaproteobacteria bacterium]|nr:hypothetical protein [Betaproteobacteria bacterium]